MTGGLRFRFNISAAAGEAKIAGRRQTARTLRSALSPEDNAFSVGQLPKQIQCKALCRLQRQFLNAIYRAVCKSVLWW